MASEHATTGDAINHAIDKASDGLAQIAHALSSAAPQAWTMAVHGVFARGVATIITGAFLAFATAIMSLICAKLFSVAQKENWDEGWVLPILLCIGTFGLGVASLLQLADGDAWVRIISPDGFLAQQILSKAL